VWDLEGDGSMALCLDTPLSACWLAAWFLPAIFSLFAVDI